MINKFREVVKNKLFRGSKPSPKDVEWLKDHFHINKIVSLDKQSGEEIDRICKLLNIHHIKAYIDYSNKSLLEFLKHDLKNLLIDDGPTFVHCQHGKDRTGLAIALYKCKYENERPERAIAEAKTLGFGLGVNPNVVSLYEKLIKSIKKSDENNADIVSNEREYKGDYRDSYLDQGHGSSFAPYLKMDKVYNEINEQYPIRQNYDNSVDISINDNKDMIPQVGVYNNDAGIRGAGPSENLGGFIYD